MINQEFKPPGLNIVDLLCTAPSSISFTQRVQRLQLSSALERRVLDCHGESLANPHHHFTGQTLTMQEEEELAGEVLYYRYKFTRGLLKNQELRQAAITVIQNIYLFQNRHIFFQPEDNPALERQRALELFSGPAPEELPVGMTLRHLVLARIWKRIMTKVEDTFFHTPALIELHSVVESLNCLRNIYVLFSTRLIRRLAGRINPLYRQSISYEDALQIGTFGVARAAYRYHHSLGIRFSTYAANWVAREIQQQALNGRLIRISSNIVEQYARAGRYNDAGLLAHYGPSLADAATTIDDGDHAIESPSLTEPPDKVVETREQHRLLTAFIDASLPARSADILKRRYGLPPYEGQALSAVEVANLYGLSRGRVYQLERESYEILRRAMDPEEHTAVLQA